MQKTISVLLISCIVALTSFSIEDLGKEVLQSTNEFRKSNGLEKLKPNEVLTRIAQQHSQNMANGKVNFGHSGFRNRNTSAAKQIPGLAYFAENVACGPTTGKDVVNLWKKSQNHRENMLGNYNIIGIGIAKSKDGTYYYTQIFGN